MSRYITEYNGSIEQQKCAITGRAFAHGDQITKYDQQEYQAILRSIGLVEDVAAMAVDQTNYTDRNIGKWCLANLFLSRKKTRSGRTVKPVIKQADLTFVAGSGVSGCDTYDRTYHCGHDTSRENGFGNDSKFLNRDLEGFVVDDSDEEALETVDLDEPAHDLKECGSDWDSESDEEKWEASEDEEDEEEWEESEEEDEEED